MPPGAWPAEPEGAALAESDGAAEGAGSIGGVLAEVASSSLAPLDGGGCADATVSSHGETATTASRP